MSSIELFPRNISSSVAVLPLALPIQSFPTRRTPTGVCIAILGLPKSDKCVTSTRYYGNVSWVKKQRQ
jgi:hypothetical protein